MVALGQTCRATVNENGAAFGSHGWGGGAAPLLEKALREAGIEVVQEGLAVAWRPSAEERAQAVAFGRAFGEQVKRAAGESE